jgi:predicted MFS family arabinose efflux permease
MVVGIVLVLVTGMLDLSLQPGGLWRELLAIGFGAGAAFVLDEFALSLHLRDVYWTREGRRSVEVSIIWMLLGLLLLVGISPFGIHDQSEIPRAIGFGIVAVNILLSVITCLKGKLTLGLFSVFLPPVGLAAACRLARPGSLWAQIFYRSNPEKRARSRARFDPQRSRLERFRMTASDLVAGAPSSHIGHESR